jgi:hypothetical protein
VRTSDYVKILTHDRLSAFDMRMEKTNRKQYKVVEEDYVNKEE